MRFIDKIKNIIFSHRGSDANKLKLDILKEIKAEEKRQPICKEDESEQRQAG